MNTIVIARYKEDVSWISRIPDWFEIFLYNKGDPIVDPVVLAKAHHIIERPNVGRESETYIYHMAHHRRADNAYTVFAQGDPFDHSPDFIELLEHWENWADLQPLTCQWKDHLPPRLVLDAYGKAHPGTLRTRPERFSLYTWGPLEFIDSGALGTAVDYRRVHGDLPEAINVAAHFLGLCEMHKLAEAARRHAIGVFCYGAVFAARNHRLLSLSPRNLELLHAASMGANCYGYVIERMWLHFFGAQFETPAIPTLDLAASEPWPAAA